MAWSAADPAAATGQLTDANKVLRPTGWPLLQLLFQTASGIAVAITNTGGPSGILPRQPPTRSLLM